MCQCQWTAAITSSRPSIFQHGSLTVHWQPISLEIPSKRHCSIFAAPMDITTAPVLSDAGLQLTIEQGGVVRVQVGVDDCSVVSHPAPVCPAVTSLYLIQARHLFQAQDILKALLEVVWQEGVQDGVSAAVGVAKHHYEVKGALHSRCRADGAGDGGDIENVER